MTRCMKLCPKLCHILTKFLWPPHRHFKKSNTISILQNMSAFRIYMIIIHSFFYKLWNTACFHQKWLKKWWNLVKSKSILFLWTSISTTKNECLSMKTKVHHSETSSSQSVIFSLHMVGFSSYVSEWRYFVIRMNLKYSNEVSSN